MTTARGVDPFLKADLLTRTPSVTGKVSIDVLQGSHPMTRGLGSHMSYELTCNAKKANRPAVISIPSSSPKPAVGRPDRHARSMQLHHGCAPFRLRRIRRSSMEARTHMSCNRRAGYYVQGNRTATCANAASSRLQNQCRDSRQPCA
jgi:hypothetical protein